MKIIRPMTIDDTALISSDVPETDYTAWAVGTTYALNDYVRVVAANLHKVYQSVSASNIGHNPTTDDGTNWIDAGSTNRWKMFDQSTGSQTTQSSDITVSLQAVGRVDSLVLLNLSGSSVRITMTDAVDGVVYDETHSLVSDSGITDWYAYFFEPIERLSELAVTDMPPYANAVLGVAITAAGETVKCGACITGLSKDIGGTQYGATVGIQDFSVKTTDTFGNYDIVERAFSKSAEFTVWVPGQYTSQLQNLLAQYRATAIVYIGSDLYDATIVYGFYKDFSIEIPYQDFSVCTIQLEGLT